MRIKGIFLYNYFFNANAILKSKRLAWIDYAKGLTIILVVYHHSFLTLVNAGVDVNTWLINANLAVYSFRMPMFFTLSGLFIAKSLQKRGIAKYIESRAEILLYPYIIWGVIQVTSGIALDSFFGEYTHAKWGGQGYLYILYQPNGTSQLWYLITLFNTSVLYSLLSIKVKLSNQKQLIIGIFLYFISPFLAFNSMIQDVTRFYVYIVFGTLISKFILDKKNYSLISSPWLSIPLTILMVFSQYYLFCNQYLYRLEMYFGSDDRSILALSQHFFGMGLFIIIVLIGCAFILNLCTLLQRSRKLKFIRVVGYHSLYIYLMHVLIVVGIRVFFVNLFSFNSAIVLLPIQIVVGTIGSVVMYNTLRRWKISWLFKCNIRRIRTWLHCFSRLVKTKYISTKTKHMSTKLKKPNPLELIVIAVFLLFFSWVFVKIIFL